MLSKPTGPTYLVPISTSTGTHAIVNFDGGKALKVRIATAGQAAVINFGNNKTAGNNSDLIQPANTVEHYKLDSTNTVTFVLITGGSAGGYISLTPVA
jgi:hypothetical protein